MHRVAAFIRTISLCRFWYMGATASQPHPVDPEGWEVDESPDPVKYKDMESPRPAQVTNATVSRGLPTQSRDMPSDMQRGYCDGYAPHRGGLFTYIRRRVKALIKSELKRMIFGRRHHRFGRHGHHGYHGGYGHPRPPRYGHYGHGNGYGHGMGAVYGGPFYSRPSPYYGGGSGGNFESGGYAGTFGGGGFGGGSHSSSSHGGFDGGGADAFDAGGSSSGGNSD
jgi:hypothetical protein